MTNVGIFGQVMANCRLSGTPDLCVRFKNPQLLDDCRFHPCVRYLKYASERVVSFVPPDGNFKLMNYKISKTASSRSMETQGHQMIPFYVKPQVTYSANSGRISIMVGLKTENAKAPEQVSVKIPLPSTTTTCDISATFGNFSINTQKQEAIWRIGKIRKDKPACLNATIAMAPKPAPTGRSASNGDDGNAAAPLPSASLLRSSESPTFEVSFQLQGLAVSGLEVDCMEVSNVKYKPYKGVRYITRSGFFQIRT